MVSGRETMEAGANVNVTIDGRGVGVEPGTTILQAASEAGVYVPHLCYHRDLSVRGSCRVCLVEVEGTPKLQPACSTVVCEGMKVKTDTEQVKEARRAVLEFMLVNHPLDCPVCDKGGECKLQDYVFWYGAGRGRYGFAKRTFEKEDIGPFVVRDMNRCIHCTRCVRFTSEISLSQDIGVFERGDRTCVGTYLGREIRNPLSGNVTELCPVGALTDRVFRFRARAWDLEEVASTCPLCAVGCLNKLQLHDGRILRIQSRSKSAIPWICDMGRFGFAAAAVDRAESYVREDGRQMPVPWDVAVHSVSGRLRVISKESGPTSIGLICGALATNEEVFALRDVFANVLKCENLHFAGVSSVRCGPEGSVLPVGREELSVLAEALRAQSSPRDFAGCDSVLFLCADPYEEAPIAGLEIFRALGMPGESRARIWSLGPRRPAPETLKLDWVPATPGQSAFLVARFASELESVAKGVGGEAGGPAVGGGKGERKAGPKVSKSLLEELSKAVGVSPEDLEPVLRMLASSRKLGIVVGNSVLSGPFAHSVLSSLLEIGSLRSALGGFETVQLCILGQGNARGVTEFGMLSGFPLASPEAGADTPDEAGDPGVPRGDAAPKAKKGQVSGRQARDAETEAGFVPMKSMSQLVDAAKAGQLRALFVFGSDPLAECRGNSEVEDAFKKIQFLVVQSDSVNETARIAHVYLPLQSIFERSGSFTDLEGRLLGLGGQASPYGESSLLFEVLSSVYSALGLSPRARDAESAFAYMKKSYGWTFKEHLKDLTGSAGIPMSSRAGQPADGGETLASVQSGAEPRGWRPAGRAVTKDRAGAAGEKEPVSPGGSSEFPYVLLCGTAGVSSWVWAQGVSNHPDIPGSAFAEISETDAEQAGISDGDAVVVESQVGRVRVRAVVSNSLMPGVVFVPSGFADATPGVLVSAKECETRVRLMKAGQSDSRVNRGEESG